MNKSIHFDNDQFGFTGAQLKALGKINMDCVVIRFDGKYQTIELSSDNDQCSTRTKSPMGENYHCFIDMYANCKYSGNADTWRFFLDSLKNTDKVYFTIEDYTPIDFGKKHNFKLLHCMAVIERPTGKTQNTKLYKTFVMSDFVINR